MLPGGVTEWIEHDNRLDRVLSPGDILVCTNSDNMLQIGAMGGNFGHVMLVTAPARCIPLGSNSAVELQSIWPQRPNVTELWAVPIMESTRSAEGLHEATLFLYVQRPSGVIAVAGEISHDDELAQCDGDSVEVWQCPAQLRELMNSCPSRSALMAETFEEMKKDMRHSNWSEYTAVRAALMPAALDKNTEGMAALKQIRDTWGTAPICTSVAIIFWQRLMCKLAPVCNADVRASPNAPFKLTPERTLSLIRRWMPVRADRSLPSEMCEALSGVGWKRIAKLRHMVLL